mmetsp:Transcript_5278/g.8117  ORF Transcript_5278/g.8117 Transcript_5278/m.8117 type:complete len:118 (-) Transcript_5278:53-406(-)|eukprot:CAMPEP_0203755970 /NCGR_PEP_ID=MMETSP0098-20131031/9302_1 /ASSEMBLY_ACC=CAM_ASM_000208 /TAXON_ID=96639 /ORGANISM=" , Strain NY0313808BC1" /LENGTH=117 /DNA_ID=CAMNT_0050647621 /DNA_START=160 /DNA_END=513 /DNA_ORIENTATION=-
MVEAEYAKVAQDPQDRKVETAQVAEESSSSCASGNCCKRKGGNCRRRCCGGAGALLVGLGLAGFFGGVPAVLGVGAAAAVLTIARRSCRGRCGANRAGCGGSGAPLTEPMLSTEEKN